MCDGSAVSRTDYAELYSVIGDTYGAGDGSTTFNLPDLVDKFVEGSATAGTEKTAGLPNIDGGFTIGIYTNASVSLTPAVPYTNTSGAFHRSDSTTTTKYFTAGGNVTDNINHRVLFDASHSNSIYGNSTTVQPPALTMQYIIKY